jgi:hypothetical protein
VLVKVRRNHLTTTWHLGCSYPINRHTMTPPNTRSQAGDAFTQNSLAQTDSAAPDPRLLPTRTEDRPSEAHTAYRRPEVARASSTNYEEALKRAKQASVSSDFSADSEIPENVGATVASPSSATGQGIVPLGSPAGVGVAQGDSLKKTRSRGLSLSGLA